MRRKGRAVWPKKSVVAKRIHLWSQCWCGSFHDWEKAKHGTVDGLTQEQIEEALK